MSNSLRVVFVAKERLPETRPVLFIKNGGIIRTLLFTLYDSSRFPYFHLFCFIH